MDNSFSFDNNNNGNNAFSGTQVLSQQGGGYFNNSMSDMAGADNTGGVTQNRMNVPSEPSLLPCTIKQIQSAPKPEKDEQFSIDNKEVYNATIVGRIVDINVESTHSTYKIDDGTGEMDVRVWDNDESKNNDNNTNDNSNDNNNNNNNSDFQLSPNMYVRCIGKIKVYQNNVTFNGWKILKINDLNEITYHNLEVIFSHLVNTNPNQAKIILKQHKENQLRKKNESKNEK